MRRKPEHEKGLFIWPHTKDVWGIRYTDEHGKNKKKRIGSKKNAALALANKISEVAKKKEGMRAAETAESVSALSLIDLTLLEASERYIRGAGAGKKQPRDNTLGQTTWVEVLGPSTLREITPTRLEAIKNQWLASNVAPGTVLKRFAFLRRVFNVLIRDEQFEAAKANIQPTLVSNPVSLVKLPKPDKQSRPRTMTGEEQQALDAAMSPANFFVVLFALLTGMRQSEQFNLKWRQVDLKKQLFTIPASKHGETRRVPIHPHLHETLTAWKTERNPKPDDPVFLSPLGHQLDATNFYNRVYLPALKTAKIDRSDRRHRKSTQTRHSINWHTLRHTACTRLIHEARLPLPVVQKIMGHKTIEMTMRYCHTGDDEMIAAISALPILPASSTPQPPTPPLTSTPPPAPTVPPDTLPSYPAAFHVFSMFLSHEQHLTAI